MDWTKGNYHCAACVSNYLSTWLQISDGQVLNKKTKIAWF
jgi:hypothetical protein